MDGLSLQEHIDEVNQDMREFKQAFYNGEDRVVLRFECLEKSWRRFESELRYRLK